MKTFDFKQARKQVQQLESNFAKVHALLDDFELSILDRGVIDTILHKSQADTTKTILTGQDVFTEEPKTERNISLTENGR